MKSNIISLTVCITLLTACAGRTANPVMISQYGDNKKSCEALEFELQNMQQEMQRILPQTNKTGKNVALGVAGYFLLVPWFFMDFSDAEVQEYNAFRQRYNHIASIAMDKDCEANIEMVPSIEEMKKQAEEAAKATKEEKKDFSERASDAADAVAEDTEEVVENVSEAVKEAAKDVENAIDEIKE